MPRLALDQWLKDHDVELAYTWSDLERERQVHQALTNP